MTNYDAVAAAFIAAVPANRKDRVEAALSALFAADRAGSIFNVDLKDLKFTLDRAAEEAFKAATEHFWAGKGQVLAADDTALNDGLNQMHWDVHPYNLHDFVSAAKKMSKVKVSHPMVDAYRAAIAAILPVAEVVAGMKSKVVMGRKPNPEAAARKAAKALTEMDRATCGCCFGNQAVLPNGKIHDHGYTLPQAWNKSASCDGRDFRSLEVSVEGPKHMVAKLERYESQYLKLIADAPARTVISKTNPYSGKTTVWKKGEQGFENQMRATISELESILTSIRSDLAKFQKVVAEWKAA
jgi:hypothetical protein